MFAQAEYRLGSLRSDRRRSRSSVVSAEAPVLGLRGYSGELRLTHVKQRLVIAGLKIALRLLLDAVVHNNVQTVALADRGHRAMGTVPEQLIDLHFIGQIDVIAGLPPQLRQTDMMRGWQDGEQVPAIAAQHDALGETFARNMTGLRRP